MKKGFLTIFVAILLLGILNVNAATESDLLDHIKAEYNVNGTIVKASEYQVAEAERYLNKYEISDEDATFIIQKIDEIVALAKADNAPTFTDLSSASKSKVVAIVAEISSKTSVKATLTTNGVLTIYESDGTTIFTKIVDEDIAKQTGANTIIYVIAGVAVLAGAVYVYRKVSSNA